ncbi:MAG TPA: SDR family oxidoreductase [Actinomycetes bacterium]
MILVVGSTGDLGGRVVRRLRDRGDDVRCLVRPQTDDTALTSIGAQTVRGDLTDPVSLRAACAGVDTVIATATAIAGRLSGTGGPSIREVDDVGMASLVEAAEEAGVRRFIYVSYAGVDAGLGFPLERAKLATERRLGASSMQVTVVRPDAFQEIHLASLGRFDMQAGKVAVFGKGDTLRRWVSTDDAAQLIVAVTTEPAPPDVVEFGGPEALSRNGAIAVAERLTGRRMKRQAMPLPVARLGMRLLARPRDGLASVFGTGVLQDMVTPRWDDAPLRERSIKPRSASEFLEAEARAMGFG